MMCDKRKFWSKREAHAAVRTMGASVRCYRCVNCKGAWHVTKQRYGDNKGDGK